MTFIIEDKAGGEVARWKTNKNPSFPDGATASGTFPDGYVHKGGDGETYTVKEVTKKAKGDGPRHVGNYGPEKIKGVYFEGKVMGEALPPTPDPEPGDDGYDHVQLRQPHMPDLGDQADEFLKYFVNTKMQQSAIEEATTIAALKKAIKPLADLPPGLDDIIGDWLDVKKRFPKE